MFPFDPPRSPAGQMDFPPAFEVIGGGVSELLERLVPEEARESDAAADLRLALTEALNNVIEHACHPPGTPVRVHYGVIEERRWVCVEDAGIPLPPRLVRPSASPDGPCGSPPPATGNQGHAPSSGACPEDEPTLDGAMTCARDMPEGGWGWLLIRGSVDGLAHVRMAGRNFLLLEKAFA